MIEGGLRRPWTFETPDGLSLLASCGKLDLNSLVRVILLVLFNLQANTVALLCGRSRQVSGTYPLVNLEISYVVNLGVLLKFND